jgi:putative ABC transport system permease protein
MASVERRMALVGDSPNGVLGIEIVGLVRDMRYSSVKDANPPIVFLPYRQDAEISGIFFYVRAW